MLRMKIERIIKSINPVDYTAWVHKNSTNCYAYALGIDIPESKIGYLAFEPGSIALNKMNVAKDDLKWELRRRTLLEKLEMDFELLGLQYEFSSTEKPYEITETQDGIIRSWDLVLMDSPYGIHFGWVNQDGVMLHKKGYNYAPCIATEEDLNTYDFKIVDRMRLTQRIGKQNL